jgi:hypothetical protein
MGVRCGMCRDMRCDATGDGRGGKAEWARVDDAVEAAAAHRQRGGSGRYGQEWGNALDYAEELGRLEASCLGQSAGPVSKHPGERTPGCKHF